MIRKFLTTILLSWFAATAALAGTILKKVPDTLSPDKAYVLVEVRHFTAIKGGGDMPSNLTLARYDAAAGDVRGGTRAKASALPDGVSPRVMIADKALAKAKSSRLYLIELEPDEWVIEGSSGTAFSLGSLRFTLEPGKIVDLGVLSPEPDWREGEGAETVGSLMARSMLLGAFAKKRDPIPAMLNVRPRGPDDIALPPQLVTNGVEPAVYSPGARFGNYLGGLINRIDGRTGSPAEPPAN